MPKMTEFQIIKKGGLLLRNLPGYFEKHTFYLFCTLVCSSFVLPSLPTSWVDREEAP